MLKLSANSTLSFSTLHGLNMIRSQVAIIAISVAFASRVSNQLRP
jgi:hypothetical protein